MNERFDLFLYNGDFHTLQPRSPRVTCVAVRGGKICRMGGGELMPILPAARSHADLGGRKVYPGFIDAHSHFVQFGLELFRPDLSDASSHEEALSIMERAVEREELGSVVIGVNWDQSRWRENRPITRGELDRVFPEHPVILRRICGHIAVANGRALERMDLPGMKVDPESGIMLEEAVLYLDGLFPPPREKVVKALSEATSRAHRKGVTTVHEISDLDNLRIYRDLDAGGKLNIRIAFYLSSRDLDRVNKEDFRGGEGGFFRLRGVKVFADGSIGAHTAALGSPYRDVRGSRGSLNLRRKSLMRLLERINRLNCQAVVHAIGDRAISQVIYCFRETMEGGNPLRHRIEHFELCTAGQIEEAGRLGLFLCVQPNFVAQWGGESGMYETVLGPLRRKRSNPFRIIDDSGVPMAFGSDCMPFSPRYGIAAAVNHPVAPQRLSLARAMELYCREGARFSLDEDLSGTMAEGKAADLMVVDGGEVGDDGLPGEVVMTVFNGEIVYRGRGMAD